ncbi:611_t:CDS:1, partial [Dentiscutata heterogama]
FARKPWGVSIPASCLSGQVIRLVVLNSKVGFGDPRATKVARVHCKQKLKL